MGGGWRSKGCEFDFLHCILDVLFWMTLLYNSTVVWKTKLIKRGRKWPICNSFVQDSFKTAVTCFSEGSRTCRKFCCLKKANQYSDVKKMTTRKTCARFPHTFSSSLPSVNGSMASLPERRDHDQVSLADQRTAKALRTPMAICKWLRWIYLLWPPQLLVLSLPTILRPRVRIPSTPSTLFFNLYWNCNEKRMKINKKRPGLAHFF